MDEIKLLKLNKIIKKISDLRNNEKITDSEKSEELGKLEERFSILYLKNIELVEKC